MTALDRSGAVAASAPARPGVQQRLRLLLVEDNPADVDLTEERLSVVPDHAFNVTAAPTLEEACRHLDAHRTDAVVLDLNLPDSTGIDTLRTLRRRHPDVPVVVLSGHDDEAMRSQALAEGAHEYISKNDPPARLVARSIVYVIERHRAMQRQRDFESLVKQNPDAVIVVDGDGVVQLVNDAALELFDRRHEDFVGELLGFSVREGGFTEVEILRDDQPRVGEVHVVDLDWGGKPGLLATIRDRTTEKRLAEDVRQAQKMDAIGRLAGGIAHDFNNLLTVILGYTELLLQHGLDDMSAEAMLRDVYQAGESARALTGQLLAFSRRSVVRPENLDVNATIASLQRMLSRVIGDEVDLVVTGDPQLHDVCIDRNHFEQVLMNLAVNARDAMPDGGSLIITTRNLTVGPSGGVLPEELDPGRCVCITVTDEGEGMTEEVRSQIFEPFFTTKQLGRGTGLGLATVYGIVRQSGGAISVESMVGCGTTFKIYLPAVPEESHVGALEVTPDDRVMGPRGDEHVLYVDDDPIVRKLTRLVLTSSGYRVTEADGGRAALAVVDEQGWDFDLLITDISMPGMDGYQLVSEIRARTGDPVRVIYLSGYDTDAQTGPGRRAFGDVYMTKPFHQRDLLQAVRDHLDGRSGPG